MPLDVEKKRFKDIDWGIPHDRDGTVSWNGVTVAVLMDIRDELKKLNSLLYCSNFIAIPKVLREISKNTKPKRRRRKK